MTNLEWLWEHDRDKLVKLITGECDMCDICSYEPVFPDCGGGCERNVREWLLAEHAQPEPAPLLSGHGEFLRESRRQDAGRGETDAERIAALEDEAAALEKELKLTRGNLKATLNNWEQARGKIRRQAEELAERRRRLDERDRKTVEEVRGDRADYWKSRAEKAEAEREEWRAKCGRMADLATGMLQVAP
jgi:hypothetical protein